MKMDPVMKLSNVIDLSLQEDSLDKLNQYLSSLSNSEEVLNGKFISVLTKILKKGGKYEEKTLQVCSAVTCLQHFVNTVTDLQKWEKVSADISKLCQLIFVISSSYIKEEVFIQKVVSVISSIAENVDCVVDNLLTFLAKTLMASSVCMTHSKYTRLLIMTLVGSLLQKSSRGIRTEILPSTANQLCDISNSLSECDDYETQLSVVEILARSLSFIHQDHQKSLFVNNTNIKDMFMKYQPFLNFDPDCRLFLNEVNESLGDQQKVFSVPCMVVSADDCRLRKPNHPAYSDFWVDFNLGSKSISFYYQLNSSDSWELMTVPQDKIISAVAKDSTCQSRSGEKFEAVKLELTIDSSDLSPNSQLPQKVKVYPTKINFLKIEHVVQKILNGKYEAEVVQKTLEETHSNKSFDILKPSEIQEEKSFITTSTTSKSPEVGEKENNKSQSSEKVDEENGEDSRKNTPEQNTSSKKKRLYCFEKSNAEDVIMSSQDQVISVEIPSYKITKKETFMKPQPNTNRKNVSYSYITNKQNNKSAIATKHKHQNQYSFEKAVKTQKSLSDDDSSENSCESSPKIFQDTKPKIPSKRQRKFFSKKPENDTDYGSPEQKSTNRPISVYSDFSSLEKKSSKCMNTYGRTKPKKQRKRVMQIESSDSDSQYTPPPKLLKEDEEYIPPPKPSKDDEEAINLSPKNTRFAASMKKDQIDPIRDKVFLNEMDLKAANDFEEPEMKPRNIIEELQMKPGKVTKKNPVKNTNTKVIKKKTTKQTQKDKKKPESKKPKQDVLKELSENLADCMDIVEYDPPEGSSPLEYEDLVLNTLGCNDDQQELLLHTTTFKVNDMVRFGKLLIKQIQDKIVKADKLAQKEREMNFATFDYKVQSSCSGLYGNCQKMESVTDKLEKLNTMLQTTYKLHKEIAAQINSEALKIEEAKNELIKNVSKTKKTESSKITAIFLEVGGYIKKIVFSLIPGNTNKNAITN